MRGRLVRRPKGARTALRLPFAVVVLIGLAACGHAPTRSTNTPLADVERASTAPLPQSAAAGDPCAPTRVHRDSDYTAGGLYAPGVPDGGPAGNIDVDRLVEPTPRREPRARTGNRSPYTVLGKNYRVMDDSRGYRERGIASWYGTKFNGRPTSSGELYDICSFTAAHKSLPLPSYVRVTNLDNGRSLVVRVNDRGPFHAGRVMDLSYAAAVRLGVSRTGTARVELEALDPDAPAETRYAQAPPAPYSTQATRAPSTDFRPNPSAVGATTLAALDAGAASPMRALPPVAADLAPPSAPAISLEASRSPPGAASRVQVGAFADAGNARRVVDRLAGAGLAEAVVDTLVVGGRPMWRVSIGAVDADVAAALVERLREMGLPDARVLRR